PASSTRPQVMASRPLPMGRGKPWVRPMNVRLYILQRAPALIMAPLVLAHLVIILYAPNRGLSAADILGRTRGSIGWGAFYTLFVLAAATHGAIGVRVIVAE